MRYGKTGVWLLAAGWLGSSLWFWGDRSIQVRAEELLPGNIKEEELGPEEPKTGEPEGELPPSADTELSVFQVTEVWLDGERCQEETLYRNGETLTLTILGEGESEEPLRLLICEGEAEREEALEYAVSEEIENAWETRISLTAEEGSLHIGIFTEQEEERTWLYQSPEIVVDRTEPQLAMTAAPAENACWGAKFGDIQGVRGAVCLTLQAADEHWTAEEVQVLVRRRAFGEEMYGEAVPVFDLLWREEEKPETNEGEIQAETIQTAIFSLEAEGCYEVTGIMRDLAGNESEVLCREFLLDGTMPEEHREDLSLEAGGKKLEPGAGDIWYSCKETKLQIKAADAGSGIRRLSLYVRGSDGKTRLLKEETFSESSVTASCMAVFAEEGSWEIGVAAEDGNGNGQEEPVWLGSFMLEQQAPELEVFESAEKHGFYRESVPLTLRLTDRESGLAQARLEANGEVLWSFVGNREQHPEQTGEVLLDAKRFQGDITIRLWAKDQAGNEDRVERTLCIDSKAPEIQVALDAGTSLNGCYYAKQRLAVVSIREEHLEETSIQLYNGKVRLECPEFQEKDGVWEANLAFAEDGRYDLRIMCRDQAGNTGAWEAEEAFVIDRTAPVIQVSYGKEASAGGWFSEKQKVVVTVVEVNPDEASFVWTMKRNGETVWEKTVSGKEALEAEPPGKFSWKGQTGTAELLFEEEGLWEWSLQAVDLAGNRSKPFGPEQFGLDWTAPTLSLSGIRNYSSNSGEVRPQVSAADEHYKENSLKIRLYQGGKEGVLLISHRERAEGKEEIRYEEWPRERSLDGRYRLEAEAEDEVGNKSSQSWWFTVNRFGSEYTFGQGIQKAEEKYYVNYIPDIRIVERNPDELKEQTVFLESEKGVRALKRGTDYEVTVSGGGDLWYSYLYEVKSDALSEDGACSLSIRSEDRAGNRMDSRDERSLAFFLDRTAPEVKISGIRSRDLLGSRQEAAVRLVDRSGVEQVWFRVNEEETAVYKQKDIEEANGIFRIRLDREPDRQLLEVEAVDLAGNRTVTKPLVFRNTAGAEPEEGKEGDGKSFDETAGRMADEAAAAGETPVSAEGTILRKWNTAGGWWILAGISLVSGVTAVILVHYYKKRTRKKNKNC